MYYCVVCSCMCVCVCACVCVFTCLWSGDAYVQGGKGACADVCDLMYVCKGGALKSGGGVGGVADVTYKCTCHHDDCMRVCVHRVHVNCPICVHRLHINAYGTIHMHP
jgi:hypothetical protein